MPEPFQITELYAFIATDKNGVEGVCAAFTGTGWLPLVGADMTRVDIIKRTWLPDLLAAGHDVRLCHFTTRREVEHFAPPARRTTAA